ncbi:MAG: molybdate ABC transporter permease subunit [Candidatus Brocadiae bacterium]|nr:molybdate ABC transporter permease subunit [Candidatus Brocadiia bacterium]
MDESSLHSIRLSLQVALISTVLVTIIGCTTAYFLATRKFRGKTVCEILIALPLIMPPTITGYYLVMIFGKNTLLGKILYDWTGCVIMFSWFAAVIASFVVSFPLMVKVSQAAIESIDKSLIDSAYILGYSEWETAVKIVLPLAKKGILSGVILSFARAIGEFGATLMLAGNIPGKTSTMPLAIYTFAASGEWYKAHGMVAILTVLSGVFLYLALSLSEKEGKS